MLVEDRHNLNPQEFDTAWGLLSSLGTAVRLPSGQMGIAGTISGCGPAYAAMFLEALGDAGVLHGLPRELSYRLAAPDAGGGGKAPAGDRRPPRRAEGRGVLPPGAPPLWVWRSWSARASAPR